MLVDADDVAAKGADVVECKVYAPEDEEHAQGEESVGEIPESTPFDQGARFTGWETGFREGEADEMKGKHDETLGADSPSEACCWEHLLGDCRVDEASCGGSGSGDGEGKTALFGEVGGQEGDGGAEDEAIANTDADPLGKEKVPVLGGEGRHEYAEKLEDGAN